jgi:hypothetical protein
MSISFLVVLLPVGATIFSSKCGNEFSLGYDHNLFF